MTPEHESYVEYLIHIGDELNGISLEHLGYKPHPDDLNDLERNALETVDLEMDGVNYSGTVRQKPVPGEAPGRSAVGCMSSPLVRGRRHPSCVAQELADRCLLDQVEVIQDLYGLDLADRWRSRLEERMLEDTDSEMLHQNAMDGFEDDVELSTQPAWPR